MHPIDWLVVAGYLAFIVTVGFVAGRGNKQIEDYFLAKRSMPWWVIGLSVMATQASAITLVGTTGQAYVDGMRFIQIYLALPIAMVILCVTLVPFFYRARVYTAYEYLENRFDGKTRSLTSFLFLLSRALADAVVIYAPSVVLSIVFGLDETTTILAIGLGATVYTAFGGMRAVMWTEFFQMQIIMVGILVCLAVVLFDLPEGVSLSDAITIAGSTGRLETIDFNPDPRVTYTFWSGMLGGLFLMLSYFGCDQSQVQRYLTAKSLTASRLSLLFTAVVKIPMQFVILLTGAMLFVFYQFEKPPVVFNPVQLERAQESLRAGEFQEIERAYDAAFAERREVALAWAESMDADQTIDEDAAAQLEASFHAADERMSAAREQAGALISEVEGQPFNDTNYIFPMFVLSQLPPGVVGLILVAILAAAMSTVESELNSLSTATVVDFYRRYVKRSASDAHYLIVSRASTVLWGGFATFGALYMGRLGSAIEAVNRIGSFFYGPILGVFVLAVAVRRANGRGAFAGLIAGIVSVWLTAELSSISYLYYNLVGCLATVAIGYLISLTAPAPPEPILVGDAG